MNKRAFAKVLNTHGISAYNDRLLLSDMPGKQWLEVPGVRRGEWERPGGVKLVLKFDLDSEFVPPHFYPEHAFWSTGMDVSEGRLLLRVGVHFASDKQSLHLRFRSERNARTQLMSPGTFLNPTTYEEALEVASIQQFQFLRGWDAYATHLQAMFPDDWAQLNAMREEWKARDAL